MSDQAETELSVFEYFANHPTSELGIVTGSVEKRLPPEPDLRCRLTAGETVAFELIEICNPKNARFMFNAKPIHNALLTAYFALSTEVRATFDDRYTNRPLRCYFKSEASMQAITGSLSVLLTELAKAPYFEEEFAGFSKAVRRIVAKVCLGGKLNDLDQVNFNLGGYFDPEIPIDALEVKLKRRYVTEHPIELLAHFGGLAWGCDPEFTERVTALIQEQGPGPFRRVWLMDWNEIRLVYTSVARNE